MIEFSHVSKRYPGEYDALRDVSFRVERGEMVFITGHSGAGKTTLLKLLSLIERPTRGQALVNGKNLSRVTTWRIPYYRRHLGIVFQNYKLLSDRTVYDNVALPLEVAGVPAREMRRKVAHVLRAVSLSHRMFAHPPALSGGEQQRVAIARAVINDPVVLLADEPTGNLDSARSREIMDILVGLNRDHGITIVMVTHEPDIAAWTRRIVRFRDGAIESDEANTPARGLA